VIGGSTLVYAKGADLLWCFPVVAIQTQALDRMQSNTGWGGCPVDFTAVAISQKYVRVFRPGRPLMPTLFFPKLDSQDVTGHHPDLRISRLPGYE